VIDVALHQRLPRALARHLRQRVRDLARGDAVAAAQDASRGDGQDRLRRARRHVERRRRRAAIVRIASHRVWRSRARRRAVTTRFSDDRDDDRDAF
jgi:hypothetical protein